MSSVSVNIPNFVSGVSQQPPTMRFSSQAESSINTFPSVIEGLVKRPPSQHIKRLYTSTLVNGYSASHLIDRGDDIEKYIVEIRNNNLYVWDTNGNSQQVWYAGSTSTPAQTYLTGAYDQFKMLTIADYTFVLNKTIYPQFTTDKVNHTIDLTTRERRVKVALITLKQMPERSSIRIKVQAKNSPTATGVAEFILETFTYANTNDGALANPDARATLRDSTNAPVKTKYLNLDAGMTDTSTIMNGISSWMYEGSMPFAVGNAPSGQSAESGTDKSIATQLGVGGWIVSASGGTIALWNYTTGTPNNGQFDENGDLIWDISTSDSASGGLLELNWGDVQSFTSLPRTAYHNSIFKITGYPQDPGDEYWVKFVSNLASTGRNMAEGKWIETIEPGQSYKIDPVTMPWALIRLSNGTFTFTPLDGVSRTYAGVNSSPSVTFTAPKWEDKKAGDAKTAPPPSFLNKNGENAKKINDIFFYKNRLGFLSEENVIFSESGKFFNFFKTTVTQNLDSDPIDISSSSVNVSNLNYAIPFFDRLLLFSDNSQFSLLGSENLTAKTASIQISTGFSCSGIVSPTAIGKNVYFAYTKNDGFSGIKEYYLNPENAFMDANDITTNVPKYIRGSVRKISASDTENTICVLSTNKDNEMYVYKFLNLGSERIQSAWTKFLFSSEDYILNVFFKKDSLFMLVSRKNGVYLERISFQSQDSKPYFEYTPRMDRLHVIKNGVGYSSYTFNSNTNTTTYTLPFSFGKDVPIAFTGQNPSSDTSLNLSSSSYIDVSDEAKEFYKTKFSTNFSIFGFFKPTSYNDSANNIIFKIARNPFNASWTSFNLFTSNGSVCASLTNSNGLGTSINSSYSILQDSWHFFVFSYSTTTNQMFLKVGAQFYGSSNVVSSSLGASYLSIPTTYFSGNLDTLAMFDGYMTDLNSVYSYIPSNDLTDVYEKVMTGTTSFSSSTQSYSNFIVNFFTFDSSTKGYFRDIYGQKFIFDSIKNVFLSPDQALRSYHNTDSLLVSQYSDNGNSCTITIPYSIGGSTGDIYIGIPYQMSHTLTKIAVRAPGQKGGQILVSSGDFQIKYGYVAYTNTKEFKVLVASLAKNQNSLYSYKFQSLYEPSTGVFKFPIFLNSENCSITFINDSAYPSSFVSGDFEGSLTNVTQRA